MASAAHQQHGNPAPAARSASVAIEVGPGRGALVVYPSERFRNCEIEISRTDSVGDGRRIHTGVHERTTQERSVLTAIFGSLPSGEYLVWMDAAGRGPIVTVTAGAVAEVRVN